MAEHEASRDEQRDDDGLALRAYYDDSLMTDQDCTMDDAGIFSFFHDDEFFQKYRHWRFCCKCAFSVPKGARKKGGIWMETSSKRPLSN